MGRKMDYRRMYMSNANASHSFKLYSDKRGEGIIVTNASEIKWSETGKAVDSPFPPEMAGYFRRFQTNSPTR